MGADFYRQQDQQARNAGEAPRGHYWARTASGRTDTDLGIAGVCGFTEYQYGADSGADWIVASGRNSMLAAGLFGGYRRSDRRFHDGWGSKGSTDSGYGGLYASWLHSRGWFADAVLKGMSYNAAWSAVQPGGTERGGYDNSGIGNEHGSRAAVEQRRRMVPGTLRANRMAPFRFHAYRHEPGPGGGGKRSRRLAICRTPASRTHMERQRRQ